GPGPNVLVRQQRHRRHLPVPMAVLTGALQNRRDVLRERDARWTCSLGWLRADDGRGGDRQREDDGRPEHSLHHTPRGGENVARQGWLVIAILQVESHPLEAVARVRR